MSAEPPSAAGRVDATPTLQRDKTGLRADAPALRLGIGRYTVDLVAGGGHVLGAVGRGVGTAPATGLLPIGTAAVLLALADTVDARTAWETQWWPLAADTTTPPEAEG